MSLRAAAWIVALSLAACGDSVKPLCTPPQHTTYSCQPAAAGTAGCVGGPKWSPTGPTDGSIYQDDVGTTFPMDCTAMIPDCSEYYMGSPRQFTCNGTVWVEAL